MFRTLRIERLEPRAMLSGVVEAVMAGDTLDLSEWGGIGPGSQHVELSQGVSAGQVVATAKGNTLLRVNGELAASAVFDAVAHVMADLGLGSDTLHLDGLAIDSLHVNNSWGHNTLRLDGAEIGGAVTVDKVDGSFSDSDLRAADCTFSGPVNVDNGGGDTNTLFERCEMGASLAVTCGAGFDEFRFHDSTASEATFTFGGGGLRGFCTAIDTGNTFRGPVVVNFGPNPAGVPALPQLDAFFSADRTDFQGSLTVNNASGDMRLALADDTTAESVTVNSGEGVEKIDVDAAVIGDLALLLGDAGQFYGSTSTLHDSEIGSLRIVGDDGDDLVRLIGCQVAATDYDLRGGNNVIRES